VIADDHPMYRYGLNAALGNQPGLELVGEAADGLELLRVVHDTRPDVVITDLTMPRLGGAEAAARLLADAPDLAVLILTMHSDDESLFAAMRAGARGYLLKGSDRAELAAAVHAVARGEAVYGPGVAQRIIDFFAGRPEQLASRAFPELTERERDVMDLLAQGSTNSGIAARLLADAPDLAVLILTMHSDDESLFAAMRAGARGYLLKGSDRAELTAAVHAVARGEAVYGPGVAQRIIDFFAGGPKQHASPAFPELTGREREVLDLLAQGSTNRGIADRLGIAEKTVRNHLSSVFVKLQVSDRTAAALKARQRGLGVTDPAAPS
jgi:DNA-binding NarL/FixJ family response regulator